MELRKKSYSYSSQSKLITLIFAAVATVCVIVEIILLVNYFKSGSLKNKRYGSYLVAYEKVEVADEEIENLRKEYESLTTEVAEMEKQLSEIDMPSQ